MAQKPTLRDIANTLSLSTAAVSMILSGKRLERFPQETIEAVHAEARKIGYVAKHADNGRDGLIIIVCPNVINPYYAALMQGIEFTAEKNGYNTCTYNTYWDIEREKKVLAFAGNPIVRGMIFSMIPQQADLVEQLSQRMPVITVGDKLSSLHLDTVEVDNYDAGYQIGKHLISLGHTHICYVSTSFNKHHSTRVLRYDGLCKSYKELCPQGSVALLSNDIDPLYELSTVEMEHQVGMELAEKCIRTKKNITAMVANNDMVAYGVIDEILREGYRIPDDYSVCGFDNIYPSQFNGVSLTTIDQYINLRGQSAFSLLQAKLERKESGAVTMTHLEFKARLIQRLTTGLPRRTKL